jgi:hypothetical protein
MGFLIPILRVPFEFPKVIYQAITIFLLIAIGWHGGEELASLTRHEFYQAGGLLSGLMLAQKALKDAGALSPYQDFSYAQYMPVMLAVMEVPGCLVGLAQIARLRRSGMDRWGTMPDEPGYNQPPAFAAAARGGHGHEGDAHDGHGHGSQPARAVKRVHGTNSAGGTATAVAEAEGKPAVVEETGTGAAPRPPKPEGLFSPKVLHEVFFNPGLYLLFGGIIVGYIGRLQGPNVTGVDDPFFITMFQGVLCLFLLEMGMTACQRLRDLKTAGVPFIIFGIVAPNVFATIGILVAHFYSHALGEPFTIGTYALFAVLCGASSYIAVPAVQRMAIPEASPTLPLAASLGLTFSYNVTIGIPVYIEIAKAITKAWPVVAAAHGA